MPRKKKQQDEAGGAVAVAEPTTTAVAEPPAAVATDATSTAAEGPDAQKTWGDPYKSIFSCPEQGFELGEHRRFKQRVFRFAERPSDDVVAALKEAGFTYRAAEKAWTVPANPDSRRMTDELARQWAGPNYEQGMER